MKVSNQGLEKIKQFEAFREYAYPDPASDLFRAFPSKLWGFKPASEIEIPEEFRHLSGAPWTIGYGFIRGVTPQMRMLQSQADARLRVEIQDEENAVTNACTVKPNQNQFDAMVSLTWNIGVNGFRKSSVLKAHNRKDFISASRAFGLWNRANGKESAGLTRRRAAEAALYLKPVPGIVQNIVEGAIPSSHAGELPGMYGEVTSLPDMPQAVEPEKTMTESAINRAGAIGGGAAALAAVSESVNTVANIKSGVDSLGQWLVPLLLIVVVGLCGYIIWTRFKQRKEGWV
jgi:lysozyme